MRPFAIRPQIFAACNQEYYDIYAAALTNSAAEHGMPCEVFNGGELAPQDANLLRYKLLPELLEKHRGLLVLDVDSVINAPIEIPDHFDLGIFLREGREQRKKTLLACFYVTDRAIDFVNEFKANLELLAPEWGYEQGILYDLYCKYKDKYNIKIFGNEFMSWDPECWAPVMTAKGKSKLVDKRFTEMFELYA